MCSVRIVRREDRERRNFDLMAWGAGGVCPQAELRRTSCDIFRHNYLPIRVTSQWTICCQGCRAKMKPIKFFPNQNKAKSATPLQFVLTTMKQ